MFAILLILRVETLFEKDGAAENGSVDFEIGNVGTTAHFYGRTNKNSCSARQLIVFLVKKKALKRSYDLFFHPSIIKIKLEEKINT